MSLIAEIQRSQLITTYGIGSIFNALNYSVIIAGMNHWDIDKTELITEDRLQKKHNVKYLRQPKVIQDNPTIPSFRFPEWVQCPKCKNLKNINKLDTRSTKKCAACKVGFSPVRFIVSCSNGHIDDFPWVWWAHRGSPCGNSRLKIHTTGKTTSLAGIRVTCDNKDCMASRTLEGIFLPSALKGKRCSGRRPWLGYGNKENCSESPRVLQRGSASVYYSMTDSAISIPPFSKQINIFLRPLMEDAKYISPDCREGWLKGKIEKYGKIFRVEDLLKAVEESCKIDDREELEIDIRQEEYSALCNPNEMDPLDDFAAKIEDIPNYLTNKISKLVLVHRLREVRVLTGFTRINPDGSPSPLSVKKENWLPASELKGEGIFIELKATEMDEWVNSSEDKLSSRVNELEKLRLEHNSGTSSFDIDNEITPQFLLIHTLAHILIQQLIHDCGYSSSSLRERIYYNDGKNGKPAMSGFLIYTATSDSEGSLGGLVRQGMSARFSEVMRKALEKAAWCSSDPLCMESLGQGHNSTNFAACHSCCLLPETSCEFRNCYLDRLVIVGKEGKTNFGFFSDVLFE